MGIPVVNTQSRDGSLISISLIVLECWIEKSGLSAVIPIKKSKPKNQDETFIDTLVEMLAESKQDLEWNEKFKAVVRKHFDI